MVLQLPLQHRFRAQTLALVALIAASCPLFCADARADLQTASRLYSNGNYIGAARAAFEAKSGGNDAEADAWTTASLMRAGLYQSASYFFIKTLESGNRAAIRRVLAETQTLMVRVGGDVLRRYLIRHTKYEDYDALNRSAYLYSLGKQALLDGKEPDAVGYFNGIAPASPLWPFALQLRGSAYAIIGKADQALFDFRECTKLAKTYIRGETKAEKRRQLSEAEDLEARCRAGEARTLYQLEQFQDADLAYDRIPKESLVWPDILFEQAWNAYGRQEYNRTLGKLVSYKSPALSFVFNSEVDVLRAQSYLALCLYTDANVVINEFNSRYSKVGEEVKRFVEGNAGNLDAFYSLGKAALSDSLYTQKGIHQMANRFVRGPYFQNLVVSERALNRELADVRMSAKGSPFASFLEQVLSFRLRSIKTLGGAFVKNSLIDYHSMLIADFEKVAFIKLEMLSRAKERLLYQRVNAERTRGNIKPVRRDDQYFWEFNGEFWNDELGDYVFGLESECST